MTAGGVTAGGASADEVSRPSAQAAPDDRAS